MQQAIKKQSKLQRLFKSPNFKISVGYFIVASLSLTAFYFAKKDITENRQRSMKIKDEIKAHKIEHSERYQHIIERNRKFEEKLRMEQQNK